MAKNFNNDDTQWIIDSDGSLVPYQDSFKNITPADAAMAERAELAIIGTKQDIERNFLKLSYLIDVFDANQLFKGRGYETMRDWAQSPEIELSWRLCQDLLRVRREVVPILVDQVGSEEQANEVLISAGVSKARAVLPLLRDDGGEEKVIDLVEKPENPRSNYAVTGLYFYDGRAPEFAAQLQPSPRGELEITDLNRCCLPRGSSG